jgi:hypothetical protein
MYGLVKDIAVIERTRFLLGKTRVDIDFVDSGELHFKLTERLPFDVESTLVKEGWTITTRETTWKKLYYDFRYPRYQPSICVETLTTNLQYYSLAGAALTVLAIGVLQWLAK